MTNREQKVKYVNQLFGRDVVTEFNMSEEDINIMLGLDHKGESIVEIYTPSMEATRNIRLMAQDANDITEAVKDLKTALEKGR